MKMILKLKKKLKECKGGTYIVGAFVILGLLIVVSVFVEYYRLYNHILVADRAYEKAMLSVAITNYDEIFATVRESSQIGGLFEGGNAGEKDSKEKPEWYSFNDEGDIAGELQSLLSLEEKSENELSAYDQSGNLLYALSNFTMQIKETAAYGSEVKYEVEGTFHIDIPVYFLGTEYSRLSMDIPSKTAWKSRV